MRDGVKLLGNYSLTKIIFSQSVHYFVLVPNTTLSGEIELCDIEGPFVTIALNGRFWHATDTVVMRVESFIKQRIPEVIEVTLDRSKSQIKEDNSLNVDAKAKKRLY